MKELKVSNFSLKDTIECGQTFCWVPEGDGYVNADIGQAVYVEQEDDVLRWDASERKVNISDLFRLDDPLLEIQKEIAKDAYMIDSIDFAPGLRIINDPVYPCLVSFLCATWKGIPAIKTMVQRIRESSGPKYNLGEKSYFGMPTPQQLFDLDERVLKSLGLAWRADFISRSTDAILNGDIDLENLRNIPYEDAHSKLKILHGVGDKVADCVCLFSLGHLEAFPIDLWVERVIKERYELFAIAGKSYRNKSEAARKYFGKYAGYAQEYLYNYSRSKSVAD
ncbi:MAG: DNA-3-methyladenine glycosylase family protein [Candidatus Thorarchaeota archaeon]|jgi:N-glycosylase/DNA lyase